MDHSERTQRKPFQANNPVFRESVFDSSIYGVSDISTTVEGAIAKTGILLSLVTLMGIVGYAIPNGPIAIGAFIVTLALSLFIGFKPLMAPTLAPIHALVYGYGVGVISFVLNTAIQEAPKVSALGKGAIPIAIFGTLLTTGVMLTLYRTRVIRVTETFKSVILGATLAVALLYLVVFLVGFAAPGLRQMAILQPTPVGIAFSVFVVALAAFNLLLDFHWMEEAANNRLPKAFEWYTGFGLMLTIVWLYVEILKLIWKISRR